MPEAQLPGVRLWYTDSAGEAVPAVLLHALTGSTESWEYQLPAFRAAGYRCITYDRRGFARSRPDPSGRQPGRATDDLHGLVEYLNIGPFHLIATAAGGAVALDYAFSYPSDLRSLVLADCVAGIQDLEYLEIQRRLRPPEFANLPLAIRELGPSYRASNADGTRRWTEIAEQNNHEHAARQESRNRVTYDLLQHLRVATLGISGDADLAAPPALMRLFVSRIPGAEFETIAEAGHASFWEQPDTWNQLVLAFIARH